MRTNNINAMRKLSNINTAIRVLREERESSNNIHNLTFIINDTDMGVLK